MKNKILKAAYRGPDALASYDIPRSGWRLLQSLLICGLALFIAPVVAQAQGWNHVGSADITSFGTGAGCIAIDGTGTPYMAYADNSTAMLGVMKYNGSSWVTVGSEFFVGGGEHISMAFNSSGTPYVVSDNPNVYYSTLSVYMFNGSNWVLVGSAGLSSGQVYRPAIAIDGSGTPYVVYEDGPNSSKSTVIKYIGSSWVMVGSTLSAASGQYNTIAIDGSGTPYVAFSDYANSNKATVMKYNGSSWVTVGSAGFTPGATAFNSMVLDASGNPYLAFTDGANSVKASLMKYNGSSWISVGSPGFSANRSYYVNLALNSSGTPYVAFQDIYNNATVMQYNGSSWVITGNTALTTSGAVNISLAMNGSGVPYVFYNDVANSYEASVQKLVTLFTNNSPQALSVCKNAGATSLNSLLAATDSTGLTFTWSVASAPSHGTLSGFPATAASGTGISPTGTSYTPTTGYTGSDAFTIQLSDGTYTVSMVVNVNVTAPPTISAGTGVAICNGSSTTLTASGGSTYSWSPGAGLSATTGASVTASPTVTTTYTVSGTTTGGCSNTATVVVTINPTPVMTVTPTIQSVCDGNNTTFEVFTSNLPGTTYTWTNNNPAIGVPPSGSGSALASFTAINSGGAPIADIFTVTPTTSGCAGAVKTFTINVNPSPVATFSVTPNPVCINSATVFASGAPLCSGNALNFTGTNVASRGIISTAINNLTMEAWVKWDGSGGTATQTVMLNGGTAHSGYALKHQNGLLTVNLGNVTVFTSSSTLVANTWTHLAVVSDASNNWTLYVNGVPSSLGNAAPYVPDAILHPGGFFIGNDPNYAGFIFHGTIDEAKFWNVARTTGQITADMIACYTAPQSGLTGYWPFSEGSGTTTADASGNGNNLTISGATWVAATENLSTYAWSFGDGATSAINNVSHTYTTAATYTPTLIVTNSIGCSGSATVAVTVNTFPTITASAVINPICAGSSTTINAAGGTSYSWSPATGLSATTGASISASPSVNTTYTVTGSNGGCTNTATKTITVNALPTATINYGSSPYCATGTATVARTGTSGGTYSSTTGLSINSSTGSINLAASSSGTYTVTYSFSNGTCSNTASTQVTVNALPTAVSGTVTLPACHDGSGTVVVSGSGGSGSYGSTVGTFTVAHNAAYSFTVTDGNGCTSGNAVSGTMGNPSAISFTATATQPTCSYNTGSVSLSTPTGGTGAITYSGDATTGLTTGTYSYLATDANGCTASQTASITNPAAISFTATATQPTCSYNTGSVSLSTPTGGIGAISFDATPTTGLTTGTYTYTATDANSCTASQTATITNPSAIAFTATATQPTCSYNTGSVSLSTPTGGTGAISFDATPTTGLTTGTYTYVATDANSCTDTQTAIITNPSAITFTATATQPTCSYNSGSVSLSTPTGGTGAISFDTTATTSLTTGSYTYTATDANSCSASQIVTVTNPSAITFIATASQPTCSYNTGSVSLSTPTGGTGAISFDATPTTGLTTGIYTYTATDANSCTALQTTTITNPSAIAFTSTATQPTCSYNTGSVALSTPTGGTGAISFDTTATTGLTTGSYTYTATDANGCTTVNTVAITNPSTISFTATATQPTCSYNTGSVSLSTPTGGTGAITYSGDATTGLTTGNYFYIATDANGCTTEDTVAVVNPSAITFTATATQPTCSYNTGSVSLSTPTGGTGAISFSSTPTSGLTTGTFTYVATDDNSCTDTQTVTITNPSAISVSATAGTIACYGYTTALTVAASGGTGTLSGTGSFTVSAGPYSYTVTDANGCTAATAGTVSQPTAITAVPTITNTSCNGTSDGSIANTVSGSFPGYTYSWSTGATTSGISAKPAGVYTLTVTDSHGCSNAFNDTIQQPGVLAIASAVNNVTCYGVHNGSIISTVTGGTTPYSYIWSPGSATTSSLSGLAPGSYYVAVTDAHGCHTTSPTYVISQPATLAASVAVTNAACNGGNGVITSTVTGGNMPYNYNWSNGSTSANLTAVAGSYSLAVTDAKGCTVNVAAHTITQPAALVLTNTIVQPSCNGNSNGYIIEHVAGGTTPYYYTWASGGYGAVHSDSLMSLPVGTYSVSVVDQHGCTANQAITVAQPAVLAVTGHVTNVACHSGHTGSVTTTVTGGTTAYTYHWSTGTTAASITAQPIGNYSVTVTDAHGCTAVAYDTLTQPDTLALVDTITSPLCHTGATGSITNGVSGGVSPYTYNWGGGITTLNRTGIAAGTFTLIVTDAHACTLTRAMVVTAPTAVTLASVISNVSCNAGSNGSVALTPAGGTSPYTYAWGNGSTSATNTGLTAGTYTVTVSDAHACTATGSYAVTAPAVITLTESAHTNVSCRSGSNGSISVTATGGTTGYTYLWTNIGLTTSTLSGITADIYTVTVTDAHGCTKTVSYPITEPLAALASSFSLTPNIPAAGGAPKTVYLGYGTATVTNVTTTTGGTTPYTYSWSSDLGSLTGTAATLAVTPTVTNTYYAAITDHNGCTTADTQTVTVINLVSTAGHIWMCHDGTNVSVATASIAADLALGYLLDTCGFVGGRIAASGSESGTSVVTDVSIRVYPNPANGQVNVEIPSLYTEAEVSITDLSGRIIENRNVTGNTGAAVQFSLNNVAPGMYLVKVNAGKLSIVDKLIVR